MTRPSSSLALLLTLLLHGPVVLAQPIPIPEERACLDAFEQRTDAMVARCRQAAGQGSLLAAYRLGEIYEHGLGSAVDYAAAADWYRQAAERGFPLAQRNLASLYENGQGVPRSPLHAFALYRQAAEQGQPHSQLKAGLMLLEGYGTEQNREEGLRWVYRAADAGEANAQHVIGELLYDSDPAQALPWFEKAVAQGHRLATYRLGLIYFRGEGVAQDLPRALRLAERDIAAGHAKSVLLKQRIQAELERARPPEAPAEADRWLLRMPPDHYTLQLAVLRHDPDLDALGRRYRLAEPLRRYRTLLGGTAVNVLLLGHYPTLAAARTARRQLPESVRQLGPLIRTFAALQQAYRPAR